MRRRWTIAGITAALVTAWSFAVIARQEAPAPDARITALVAVLGTRDWDKAVEDLVAIGEPAVGRLRTELRTGTSAGRAKISLALARIGTAAAVDAVHEALASPDPVMRENAATALRFVRSDRSVTALIGVVTRDGWQIRRAAAASLGALGDPRAVEALTGVLKDPAWYIREDAIRALGRIKSGTGVAPLVAALGDPHGSVRQAVRAALVAHGAAAVPAVDAALFTSGDTIGWQAAWILGHIDDPAAIDPLLRALERGSPAMRVEAAVGLARIGGSPGGGAGREVLFNSVTRLLENRNPALRDDAAWILERLRSPRAEIGTAARTATATPCAATRALVVVGPAGVTVNGRTYRLYPETLDARPDIPSPLTAADGTELIVAATGSQRFGIVPVTLKPSSRQCNADGDDFPALARTGLHSDAELGRTRIITGRSVAEITELGRPGRLSDAGFLGADEDIVSVLKADNQIVAALGLTHPALARPLFYVLNTMQTDLDLGRWDMAEHRWRNITSVFSHGRVVRLEGGDTKGSQQSIFDDGIEGSCWIEISGELTGAERAFLKTRYPHLDTGAMDRLVQSLTRVRTGEIQPHYVAWYGFYEGSTPWRTDPIAMALVFGLRTLEQIEAAFPGRLYELMMSRFVTDGQ